MLVVIVRHLNTRSQEERVDWELLMLGDCCVTEKKINEKSPIAEKQERRSWEQKKEE
jgi:hypothetical protein